jgi:hypothetical protein
MTSEEKTTVSKRFQALDENKHRVWIDVSVNGESVVVSVSSIKLYMIRKQLEDFFLASKFAGIGNNNA